MKTEMSDIQWLKGALYGAISYLTAISFTAMWFYFDHYSTPIRATATTQERIGLGVGTFYNGQFVAGGRDFLFAYGSAGHGFLLTPLYRVIPVLGILLIAGAFVYAEVDARDRSEAVLSGASLAPGYLVLSLVVVLTFRSLAGPDFLPIGMAAVSGILYPAIVGGLAGLVAGELKGYVEESPQARGLEENL